MILISEFFATGEMKAVQFSPVLVGIPTSPIACHCRYIFSASSWITFNWFLPEKPGAADPVASAPQRHGCTLDLWLNIQAIGLGSICSRASIVLGSYTVLTNDTDTHCFLAWFDNDFQTHVLIPIPCPDHRVGSGP